jgi:uncharacterized OB-fold protein
VRERVVTLQNFFERAREGQLTGVRCTHCGELAIPPREFCPACGKRGWEPVPLAGEGVVDSFTVIRVAPRKFAAEAPYAVAHVRLSEGVSLLGRVVDVPIDALAVGLRVRFRPLVSKDQTAVGFGPM